MAAYADGPQSVAGIHSEGGSFGSTVMDMCSLFKSFRTVEAVVALRR